MSCKVIKTFRDKSTKKTYKKGSSYSHENEERIAFLIGKGYLEGSKSKEEEDKSEETEVTKEEESLKEIPKSKKAAKKDA